MTTFPELTLQPDKFLWNPANILPVFRDTPLFYQCLIGEQPPTQEQCKMISQALGTEGLFTCSNGAYCQSKGTGSHGWVIYARTGSELMVGAGPADGHPDFMSSYRSELGGILASLYIIYRICSHFLLDSGPINHYCDNKGGLHKAY
jgi:hypothetical protein